MGLRSRLLQTLRRSLGAAPPPPRSPPPPFVFVPDPAAQGLETPAADLLARQARGDALLLLIDVRADNERDLSIPGALHIPLGELPVRWGEVADAVGVSGIPVCYCATGGQSINAAAALRERGLPLATSILDGLPGWEDAGGPTVRAP